MRKHRLAFILFIATFLFSNIARAGYPIQSTTILTVPYSVYLADYASDGSNRLKVILTLNDLTVPQYQVFLQMSISLNGKVIMRTSANWKPAPLTVLPGVPVVMSGADLEPYLNSSHIDFTGYSKNQYEQTKALPEGSYSITFTAYSYVRPDQQLSNEGMAFFYFAKSDPPLVSYPACGQRIGQLPYWGVDVPPGDVKTGQPSSSLIFQWIPRNTASLNSALNTEYKLELWEVRVKGTNPNVVVQSMPPIFTTITDATTYVYSPADPPLVANMYSDEEGSTYAWRVTAIDKSGRDLFANNGMSQVCYFNYGGQNIITNLAVPQIQAVGETYNRGKVWWAHNSAYDKYTAYYRKAGSGPQGFEWFPAETTGDSVKIYDLEPLTTYETRVQGRKGTDYGPYSEIKTFKTPEKKVYNCGETPPTTAGTPMGDPYTGLPDNKIVTLGNSEIQVLKITANPQPGWYSGEGSISLMGLLIRVGFNNIYVNTDLVVTRGEAHSIRSKTTAELLADQKKKAEATQILQNWNGKIPDPETATLPELKEFVTALLSIPDEVINGSIVISPTDKQIIAVAKVQMVEAMETLNNPNATPEEKKAAEAKLRDALKVSKGALDKLSAGVGNGLANLIGDWFKNIRAYLSGYKGSDDDKQKAIYWHAQTDSAVAALRLRTDIPDSLMQRLNKSFEAAKPAWAALEKGSAELAYNNVKGPAFEDAYYYAKEAIDKCNELVDEIERLNLKFIINGQFYFNPSGRLILLGEDIKGVFNPSSEISQGKKVNGFVYGFITTNDIVYDAVIENGIFKGYYNKQINDWYNCNVHGSVPTNLQMLGVFFDGTCNNNYYSFPFPASLDAIKAPLNDSPTPLATAFPLSMDNAVFHSKAKINGLNCPEEKIEDVILPSDPVEGSIFFTYTTKKELINTPLFGKSLDVPSEAALMFVAVTDKQINKVIWILYSLEYNGKRFVWDDAKKWYYTNTGEQADNSFLTTVTNSAGAMGGFFVTSVINTIENGNPFYQFKDDYKAYGGSIPGYVAKVFKDGVVGLVSDIKEGGYKRKEALVSIFITNGALGRLGVFMAPAMNTVVNATLKAGCRIIGSKTIGTAATIYYLNTTIATFDGATLQLTSVINGATVTELSVIENVSFEAADKVVKSGTVKLVKDVNGNVGWSIIAYSSDVFDAFATSLSKQGYGALKNKFIALADVDKTRFVNNFSNAPTNVLAALNNTSKDLFERWQKGLIKGNPDGFNGYFYETNNALAHSDIGDFALASNPYNSLEPGKMLSGGHGQKNILYLNALGRKYNIEYTFENGVRTGYVELHANAGKKTGVGQSWFPETWTTQDIEDAGMYVMQKNNSLFANLKDGEVLFDEYKGVRVGIIKEKGNLATMFPDNSQPLVNGNYELNSKK